MTLLQIFAFKQCWPSRTKWWDLLSNSVSDTLPLNANLHLWCKKPSAKYQLFMRGKDFMMYSTTAALPATQLIQQKAWQNPVFPSILRLLLEPRVWLTVDLPAAGKQHCLAQTKVAPICQYWSDLQTSTCQVCCPVSLVLCSLPAILFCLAEQEQNASFNHPHNLQPHDNWCQQKWQKVIVSSTST